MEVGAGTYSHARSVRIIQKEASGPRLLLRTNNTGVAMAESCRTENVVGSTHRRSTRETVDVRETSHEYFQENIARTSWDRSTRKEGPRGSFSLSLSKFSRVHVPGRDEGEQR